MFESDKQKREEIQVVKNKLDEVNKKVRSEDAYYTDRSEREQTKIVEEEYDQDAERRNMRRVLAKALIATKREYYVALGRYLERANSIAYNDRLEKAKAVGKHYGGITKIESRQSYQPVNWSKETIKTTYKEFKKIEKRKKKARAEEEKKIRKYQKFHSIFFTYNIDNLYRKYMERFGPEYKKHSPESVNFDYSYGLGMQDLMASELSSFFASIPGLNSAVDEVSSQKLR